jgi:class 3 adenylate cyclase
MTTIAHLRLWGPSQLGFTDHLMPPGLGPFIFLVQRAMMRAMGPDPEAVEEILRKLGVPEDAIERARGREDPLSAFFESMPIRGAADRTVSPAQIEAQGGMPVAQAQELMRAFGLPPPDADEPAFTPGEAHALSELWRHQEVWPFELGIQIARLYGRLLARIAQASVTQWLAVAEPRLRAAEPDEARRTIAAADSFDRLLPVADALLSGVHRRWVERETAQIAVRAAESGAAARLLAGVAEVSILFCDLKDFTAFADRQGDGAAVRIIDRFASTVMDKRGDQAGLTKLLGDGFMLVYPEPAAAVAAGRRIIEEMRSSTQPGVHASVHHGPAVPREGDYFGQAVNLAARLLVLADCDELLATAPVVERARGFEWEHCGSERMRGFSDEVQVYRLKG